MNEYKDYIEKFWSKSMCTNTTLKNLCQNQCVQILHCKIYVKMNKYKYYIENFEILSLYWYHFMILVKKIIFVVFDNVKLA